MPLQLFDAMGREGFEEVVALHDGASGARALIAVHDSQVGPAFGGIRRWTYEAESGALLDALRLSRAMSRKCALLHLPAGGGKVVLLDGEGLDLEAAYRSIGRAVERMAGRFYTGPDVNTGAQELSWVHAETRYVTDPGPEGPGELSACTAEGVFLGMEAALLSLDGEVDWGRRTVVVQGLGAVGFLLAARLVGAGARVIASEADPQRVHDLADHLDVEMVDPGSELTQPCDLFAPCAMGGILHDLTIERLRCRIVAGAANNQLSRSHHGEQLHERGVLFVPDFALNTGALVRGAMFHLEGRREPVPVVGARVRSCVEDILARALSEGRPTSVVGVQLADERLAARRA
ncbi:MAG: leucine dehydrogenase [Planctomycetota bacterium]|nr:leucine dehydrogenase [Planctomycetota bacterium]